MYHISHGDDILINEGRNCSGKNTTEMDDITVLAKSSNAAHEIRQIQILERLDELNCPGKSCGHGSQRG